jgi:hypothetical protein
MPVQGTVLAGENSVFGSFGSGIRMLDYDQQVRTICDEEICRGRFDLLSSRYIAVSSKIGIGVVDIDRGLAWSKLLPPQYDPRRFDFGWVRSALSGTKFALRVSADKKTVFDGVDIKGSTTVLAYDVVSPKSPVVVRIKPVQGQSDFALSPSAAKLAVFDGAKVLIYSLN